MNDNVLNLGSIVVDLDNVSNDQIYFIGNGFYGYYSLDEFLVLIKSLLDDLMKVEDFYE